MLISLRISSASIRDKLPLQPPDGNELKMMFSTTSGLHAFTNLKSTKKKYRLPPGMVTVTWNLTCSFSKTKLKNLLLAHKIVHLRGIGCLRTCVFGPRPDWMSSAPVVPSIRPRYDDQHDQEYLEGSFGQAVRLFEYLSCPKKLKNFWNFQALESTWVDCPTIFSMADRHVPQTRLMKFIFYLRRGKMDEFS